MERNKSVEWPKYGDALIKELISGEARPRDMYSNIFVIRQEQVPFVIDADRLKMGVDLRNLTQQGIVEYRREVASDGEAEQYFRLTEYGATVAYAKGFITSDERVQIGEIYKQNPYDPI